MPPDAHYLIRIAPERAHILQQALATLNIDIDLRTDMIATGQRNLLEHSIVSGSDVTQAVREINRYLQDCRVTPLMDTQTSQWDLADTAAFLDIAAGQFRWTDSGNVAYAVWEGNPAEWQENVDNHPRLFTH